jgi:nucleoside-diphosphate-sugar epimerase
VRAAVAGVDIVIHSAGLFDFSADRDLLFAVNAEGAQRVAETAADEGVKRMVLISSTGVYGGTGIGIGEDSVKRPVTDYDQSKWAGEQRVVEACERRSLPLAVLRPTLIYGPGSRYGLASWLALFSLRRHLGLRKLPIAPGGPLGHHVHVDDVARAAELLSRSEAAVGGVFNVADQAPLPAGDLVRLLGGATGLQITDRVLPWWITKIARVIKPLIAWVLARENKRTAHLWAKLTAEQNLGSGLSPRVDPDWIEYVVSDHTFDTSRLAALGFTLTHPDVRDGMKRAITWYRERKWLPERPA